MPKADDTIVLPLGGKSVLLLIGGIDAAKKLAFLITLDKRVKKQLYA
jgi:hypothetical protein